ATVTRRRDVEVEQKQRSSPKKEESTRLIILKLRYINGEKELKMIEALKKVGMLTLVVCKLW
ncbi:hypothetical protein LINPERHAP1_LOCUS21019, partial [Linum perenne]